jgi:DNA-3-methyladenine glycosylase I
MTDYKAIFETIEASMYANSRSADKLRESMEWARKLNSAAKFNDEEYYDMLLIVTFASGFNAATAMKYHEGLRKHFPSIAVAASLTEADLERIRLSGEVVKHKRKLKACVENARAMQSIAQERGSLQSYIDLYKPTESFENLMLLNEALRAKFRYISDVTVFHLMTDAGLPVLKPDRVITRTFYRLGLIESEAMELHAILVGRKFAEATGHSIRYIDAVFVSYGQERMWDGSKGICIDNPKCSKCHAQSFCNFYQSSLTSGNLGS